MSSRNESRSAGVWSSRAVAHLDVAPLDRVLLSSRRFDPASPDQVFSELGRALRPSGRLVLEFSTTDSDDGTDVVERVLTALARAGFEALAMEFAMRESREHVCVIARRIREGDRDDATA